MISWQAGMEEDVEQTRSTAAGSADPVSWDWIRAAISSITGRIVAIVTALFKREANLIVFEAKKIDIDFHCLNLVMHLG
jgi:hypothetical protein